MVSMEGVTIEYENVRHKKKEGTVTLSDTQLEFRSTEGILLTVLWSQVEKHRVSPIQHPKALLNLVLRSQSSGLTFQLPDRAALDRIRKDITDRLANYANSMNGASKKRQISDVSKSSFGVLDSTAVAVARSSLLAAHPALRQQHTYLVQESGTVTEEDFWKTHRHLLEEEVARIAGLSKAGTSSLLQSHVPASGRVTLGVEEMRQIFILYPAVHRAYEEKVPLELSDEQFWRKYLESEYFHRDRGRIGTAARNHGPGEETSDKTTGLNQEQQDARAAAISADDLFSRYDQKLQDESEVPKAAPGDAASKSSRRWGRHLAVGQFDLASTFETERGELLEGPKDDYPPNSSEDGQKGARVIQKYNRHWAMVLHPDQAVAGANLLEVARQSVQDSEVDNIDAQVAGGTDEEMRRLVDFANAEEEDANHVTGVGHVEEEYEPLTLRNIEVYYAGLTGKPETKESQEAQAKRHSDFAKVMAAKARSLAISSNTNENHLPKSCFPPAALGKHLLTSLTEKFVKDSQTEADSLTSVNALPEELRRDLQSYFRRSSELLRHFFALRKAGSDGQKLARIVGGMVTFFREMEAMRENLPQTVEGERMRKMCLPIMEQLNSAVKLHREGSGGGGGGGFVTVQ
jgi:transcription initiation factor TFIIH subunit 1